MTSTQYKSRITALGFSSVSSWAKFVGIDRTTHFRHLQGSRAIPKTLLNILDWLENDELDNPNFTDED